METAFCMMEIAAVSETAKLCIALEIRLLKIGMVGS